MTEAEVLFLPGGIRKASLREFHRAGDISFFLNQFVSFFFIFSLPGEIAKQMFFEHISLGKLGRGGIFSHDAVVDFIVGEEFSVRLSKIPFIGIYFFEFLVGMKAVDSTIGQVGRVVMRSRRDSGCQDKSVVHINRGMFFKAIMKSVILKYLV